MTNFTTTLMGSLSAERNAMRDDVREAKIFRADRVQERLSSLQSHDVHRVEEPRGASDSDEPNMLSFLTAGLMPRASRPTTSGSLRTAAPQSPKVKNANRNIHNQTKKENTHVPMESKPSKHRRNPRNSRDPNL